MSLLSASSINTFRQCPRKYYYQYILRIKTTQTIHLIRGSLVHDLLDQVWDIDVSHVRHETARLFFGTWLLRHLKAEWKKKQSSLTQLGLSDDQLTFYFEETRAMLRGWMTDFLTRLRETHDDVSVALAQLTPIREKRLECLTHKVMGFVDVIEMVDDTVVRVIDYKTSSKNTLTPEYRLQLAIYALLVQQTYGHAPREVAIHFLRHGVTRLDVDQELLDFAKREIAWVLERVADTDINNYPKKVSPLCKWSNARGSGQCDFYDRCFSQHTLL